MKRILPIAIIVAAAVGFIAAWAALMLIAAAKSAELITPVAVFIWAVGSTLSAVPLGLSFIFLKSKLCRASAVISGAALVLTIVGLIVLW